MFLSAQDKLYQDATTLYDKVEGGVLLERYEVTELLDEGSNGCVFRVTDRLDETKRLVAKI